MATIFRKKEGIVHNPLNKGNVRNSLCICGSGVKTKKCCGETRYLKESELKDLKNLIKLGSKIKRKADESAEV